MKVTRRIEETTLELLLHEGLIDKNGLEQARARARDLGETPPEAAINIGLVSEKDIARTLCRHLSLPYLNAAKYFVKREVFDVLPIETCETYHLIPLDIIGDILIVAISEALPQQALDEMESTTKLKIRLYVSTLSSVSQALRSLKEQAQPNKQA